MSGKIVLFGATGYTGELTARELVGQGATPLLAARSQDRVAALGLELGLESAVADVADPASIASLLDRGDVLLTTVGPFTRLGRPALDAAVSKGAHYVDSTGEPSWIRSTFDRDSEFRSADIAALTAFGYDYVPGNLAAGLVLDRASSQVSRVDIGYFLTGKSRPSGGTAASLGAAMLEPGFEWSNGRLVSRRAAATARKFSTSVGERSAISLGGSENIAIPRIAPQVRDVRTYLGWIGPTTAPVRAFSAGIAGVTKIPGARQLIGAGLNRVLPGSTGGPDLKERDNSGTIVIAEAYGANDQLVERVELTGRNAYDLTAGFLAEAARALVAGSVHARGALGPVEALGLNELQSACKRSGLLELPS